MFKLTTEQNQYDYR